MTAETVAELLAKASHLLDRLERLMPAHSPEPDFGSDLAFRWRGSDQPSPLKPIRRPHRLDLEDLLCVDRQKAELDRNTRQFLHGLPANNALLWGSKGTGKSSLVKALLTEYAGLGLRVVEVDRQHLVQLPDILELLHARPEKFILYCDDLAFETDDAGYKALKAVLDGSFSAPPPDVLIYATSNRRHLLPEYFDDNQGTRTIDGEIHQSEAVEEKISLSERFGLWLSFQPFTQDQYLEVVSHWLKKLGPEMSDSGTVRTEALRYALSRGSRSGRVAWQFAKDWIGKTALSTIEGDSGP